MKFWHVYNLFELTKLSKGWWGLSFVEKIINLPNKGRGGLGDWVLFQKILIFFWSSSLVICKLFTYNASLTSYRIYIFLYITILMEWLDTFCSCVSSTWPSPPLIIVSYFWELIIMSQNNFESQLILGQ